MLVDTHCHLTHSRFSEDIGALLSRAWSGGVGAVVAIASDLDDAARLRELVSRDGREPPESGKVEGRPGGGSTRSGVRLFRTVGIHPHQASSAPDAPALEAAMREEVARAPAPVAVGECGLDFHYDFAPRPRQRELFQRHLQLAQELDLPVVVHCREAEAEMIPRVREAGEAGVRGVLHCYPGDLELLEVAMAAGWFVSFTGLVTFSSFDGLEAVRRVPGGRYMLETDGPYMAPVPHRGKRNEPSFVPAIRDQVARIRGEPPAQVEEETTRAAGEFFRLSL
jgi:TatD DNase family protein